MCSGNQNEVEKVKNELLKAGIASETRRHPIAEAMGVSGLELWVQNERDFFDASKLYARLQDHAANGSHDTATKRKTESSGHSVNGSKPQAESSSPPPNDVSKVDSGPAVQPRRLELKEASSLLQKGIEEMLLRESQLAEECSSLRGKVEDLTRALAQAQTDVAREIESREAAERKQAEQFTGLLDTLERERREWQQKLKSSDDSFKNAKEQVGSLNRMLQTQQAAAKSLREEIVSLEHQRAQQEQALSDARKEAVVEREARVAAEERATFAEESLQTQWIEHQELERQIQAHAASLGSLLARVTSKAVSGSGEP